LKGPVLADESASQLEITELSGDVQLKSVLSERTAEFWKMVPTESYPSRLLSS